MHKHLKRDDRVCIALMLKQGRTYAEIGKELDFHRTTILREVKRNGKDVYKGAAAHRLSKEKRRSSKINQRIIENNSLIKKEIHS